eukprot:TRINITY_DN21643_c0_g1_i1.p1 TRINITY_DN21643_c0_g1~~TRINITY_DN21643_c0_g1_i1.p1  ORF type:complete len:1049 (-),score=132.01 TRINITY_DN21643_c0_g1_i1:9-3155(-)
MSRHSSLNSTREEDHMDPLGTPNRSITGVSHISVRSSQSTSALYPDYNNTAVHLPLVASVPNPLHRESLSPLDAYTAHCHAAGTEPLPELLAALADPSATVCSLSERRAAMTDRELACLCAAVRNNRTIFELDLEGCHMSTAAAAELGQLILENCTLHTLRLGGNGFCDEATLLVSSALHKNTSILVFDLKASHLGLVGGKAIATMLQVNNSLTELNFQRNSLKSDSCIALAKALRTNPSVLTLMLRFNEIGDAGAIGLADLLRVNAVLTTLDLGGNCVQSAGGRALAEALRRNSTLRKLNLRSNLTHDESAIAFAGVLQTNTSLSELFLGHNELTQEGVIKLVQALITNCSLQKLDVQGTFINSDTATALADVFSRNSSLVQLALQWDPTDTQAPAIFAAGLRHNTTLTDVVVENDRGEMEDGLRIMKTALLAATDSPAPPSSVASRSQPVSHESSPSHTAVTAVPGAHLHESGSERVVLHSLTRSPPQRSSSRPQLQPPSESRLSAALAEALNHSNFTAETAVSSAMLATPRRNGTSDLVFPPTQALVDLERRMTARIDGLHKELEAALQRHEDTVQVALASDDLRQVVSQLQREAQVQRTEISQQLSDHIRSMSELLGHNLAPSDDQSDLVRDVSLQLQREVENRLTGLSEAVNRRLESLQQEVARHLERFQEHVRRCNSQCGPACQSKVLTEQLEASKLYFQKLESRIEVLESQRLPSVEELGHLIREASLTAVQQALQRTPPSSRVAQLEAELRDLHAQVELHSSFEDRLTQTVKDALHAHHRVAVPQNTSDQQLTQSVQHLLARINTLEDVLRRDQKASLLALEAILHDRELAVAPAPQRTAGGQFESPVKLVLEAPTPPGSATILHTEEPAVDERVNATALTDPAERRTEDNIFQPRSQLASQTPSNWRTWPEHKAQNQLHQKHASRAAPTSPPRSRATAHVYSSLFAPGAQAPLPRPEPLPRRPPSPQHTSFSPPIASVRPSVSGSVSRFERGSLLSPASDLVGAGQGGPGTPLPASTANTFEPSVSPPSLRAKALQRPL